MSSSNSNKPDLQVGNYIVAFVDLLGQRVALHNQGLMPRVETEEDKQRLVAQLKASIGSIAALQDNAAKLMNAMHAREDKQLRDSLPLDKRAHWDELLRPTVKSQYWSDGLVLFSPAADELARCPTMGVYEILTLCGALCFLGLASKRPLRGGVEIAWAVEMRPNELYGAAIARAYELESQVADYPRIVVGPLLVEYLQCQAQNPALDLDAQINRSMAAICMSLLAKDVDGSWLVDYLGAEFREAVTNAFHDDLFSRASAYIQEQLTQHRKERNSKLAFRYTSLERYFQSNQPQ